MKNLGVSGLPKRWVLERSDAPHHYRPPKQLGAIIFSITTTVTHGEERSSIMENG